jgi:hypothetical protein
MNKGIRTLLEKVPSRQEGKELHEESAVCQTPGGLLGDGGPAVCFASAFSEVAFSKIAFTLVCGICSMERN